MTNQEIVDFLNGQWPPSVQTLKGRATGFDQYESRLDMDFATDSGFCHSGDIVQGGYISGMLDAVMAYAVIGIPGLCDMVATLEIKVSFMQISRNGEFSATGRIVHAGRAIAYLEGQLYQGGKLVAAATSTVKLLKTR